MPHVKKKNRVHTSYLNFFITFIVSQTARQKPASTIPKDYLGMLEYKREDEPRLIENIILGILPLHYVCNMPMLPAFYLIII